jgi:hypothetical protein
VASAGEAPRLLDGFDDAAVWQVGHSDDVSASLHSEHGALCVDFDFNGVSGYVSLRRSLPMVWQGNFALSFRVRGKAPANALQLKLIDASGDNVWWYNQPDFQFGKNWQTVRAERGQIGFAWGPAKDHALRRTAAVELAIAAGKGGRGQVCFDDLRMQPLPPPRTAWPAPIVHASSALPGHAASRALDGNPATAWRSDPARGAAQTLTLDFGATRPLGGLVLHWQGARYASRYDVQASDDGRTWNRLRRVADGNGGDDPLLLADTRTRYLRVAMQGSVAAEAAPTTAHETAPAQSGFDGYALSAIDIEDLAWGATPNGFFERLAQGARRGLYPRGFSGEQSYWTLVGVDGGGAHAALLSEDGALEIGMGGFSLEPLLLADGRLLDWADVRIDHALTDGYLPMPSATWQADDLSLRTEAFARGDAAQSQVLARYTVGNRGDRAHDVTLALAVRPFQVNPPTQFLNSPGGVSPVHALAWTGQAVAVNGAPRLFPLQAPDRFVASSFDAGNVVVRLAGGDVPMASTVHDDFGYASGALLFHLRVPAHGTRSIELLAPLNGAFAMPSAAREQPATWFDRQRDAVAAHWHGLLDRVEVRGPAAAQPLIDTVRSSLAWILISRDGPALQPGTRSYARTWIRDGAMMAEGLLRTGHADVVRAFADWYAPHQFSSGKVPCCVDARGSDPVPENDSHGELIFTIAELYRYTHDRATLEKLWPHVRRAIDYMDTLRASERGAANRMPATRANYGLLPASISHEGYSAKPMHSYWDDFWGLKGYDDAVELAGVLGKTDAATRIAQSRDRFRADLLASIRISTRQHGIDYIPGAAELGDFDATSTTIALAPGGDQDWLPPKLLHGTFERYWQQFVARRDGRTAWDDYTPYEIRNVGAFVRLGWRDRIPALLDFFFAGRRPPAWNGWAEVVGHDARKPRFVGDMPHAWIASDFLRSALDMFAWERQSDRALVLAAGVPAAWLDGDGITLAHLRTPYGELGYRLRRDGAQLYLHIDAGAAPPGGFVLPWPYPGTPGAATIDGRPATWSSDGLHIARAPADVVIQMP